MKIGHLTVGEQPITLAEIGLNHCGDIGLAVAMIQAAKEAGCDIAKFQTFHTENFCQPDDPMFPVFKRCQLPDDVWPHLKTECDKAGIMFMSTPQNPEDLELLLPLGMPAIKIGSDDACNLPLIRAYSSHGLPLIISTGMCDWDDISNAVDASKQLRFDENGDEIDDDNTIVMVCSSQYPCPPEEVNTSRFPDLLEIIASYAGFSDHTIGNTASIMSVALGACVFERHFTMDKTLPGPDHSWACDPAQLASWVHAIHEAWAMRGTGRFELSEKEAAQKAKYQRRAGRQLRGA